MSKLHRIPEEGLEYALCEGNTAKRIHLDSTPEGIALSLVGAASATLSKGNRQILKIARNAPGGGLTLVLVGAASA